MDTQRVARKKLERAWDGPKAATRFTGRVERAPSKRPPVFVSSGIRGGSWLFTCDMNIFFILFFFLPFFLGWGGGVGWGVLRNSAGRGVLVVHL